MIQHEPEIFFLFNDLMPFLVEDSTQTVECLVEPASHQAGFVEPEIEFLILESV